MNTRLLLSELGERLARRASLDDVSDTQIDAWSAAGFAMIWLMGVWQTGARSRQVSRSRPDWRAEYLRVVPDLRDEDVCGSCFAVCAYEVHQDFGGDAALARLRQRMARRGLGLMLDFVPNHVGLDHPWIDRHLEFFIAGSETDARTQPERFTSVDTVRGTRVLALGRDPYFPGWPDTLQLNYAQPALQAAMNAELGRVAQRCDGVRCDMAMLILPEVVQRTWGLVAQPFWPGAIAAVRSQHPGFIFLAEAYWGLEPTLQQQGFDFTYDKGLYDRLSAGEAQSIREYLAAPPALQARCARFLENHDEPRSAARFAPDMLRAAAVICFFAPGLRLFQRGQREGRRARVPVHLGRAPHEQDDASLSAFYDRLWSCLRDEAFHAGEFVLLRCDEAWPGNTSHQAFVAFAWSGPNGARHLIAVNYAPHPSQCRLRLPWAELGADPVRLDDRLHDVTYERDTAELGERGLYIDLPAWGYHLLRLHGR